MTDPRALAAQISQALIEEFLTKGQRCESIDVIERVLRAHQDAQAQVISVEEQLSEIMDRVEDHEGARDEMRQLLTALAACVQERDRLRGALAELRAVIEEHQRCNSYDCGNCVAFIAAELPPTSA